MNAVLTVCTTKNQARRSDTGMLAFLAMFQLNDIGFY